MFGWQLNFDRNYYHVIHSICFSVFMILYKDVSRFNRFFIQLLYNAVSLNAELHYLNS